MEAVFYATLFILGLATGSFLNVLTLRYQPERSVFSRKALGGRSHCPHCRKTLTAIELIPLVSFLIQRGRCSACGEQLSLQYPLVELVSGAVWVMVPLSLSFFYNIAPVAFASLAAPLWFYGLALVWIVAFLTWLAIFVIDMRHYLIPNELNILLAVLGVAAMLLLSAHHGALPVFRDSFLRHYALLVSPTFGVWAGHLLGAAAGGLIFGFLVFLGRGRAMGVGDVKLAIASGILLGWPDILLAAFLAFIVGGVWGVVLVLAKEKKFSDRVPFAPFFVIGAAITVFGGYHLLRLYFSLFGL
ncbi:MAG: prepilin peptidase [Candidatus Jorgensenbacteria bacterium]